MTPQACRRSQRATEAIARSGVVHGSLRPRGPSTVVCGFVDPARACCWQYAPDKGAYAKVGEWIT